MGTGTAELPVGLAKMAPGPELAAALSTVDLAGLPAEQLQVVVMAQGRQVAHEQARLLAAGVALSKVPWADDAGPASQEQIDKFASTRVAWTLTVSEWSADKLIDLGRDLIDRLPMVYEALLAGRIDYPRAWTFSKGLDLLPDEVARTIATSLLREAERLTPGKLKARLALRAARTDPTLAKRRYKRSVADRRVHIGLDSEGTARLSGQNLPADRAAAAEDRLDRLARAARADGDSRTLDQLRADAMLDVLAGKPFQLHPDTDPVTAGADQEAAAAQAEAEAARKADVTFAARVAAAKAAAAARAAERDADADEVGVADREWVDRQCWGQDPDTAGARGLGRMLGDGNWTPGPAPPGAGMCTCGGVRPAERRGVVDLIVPLSTLVDATDHPGLIPGWGPVLADIARQVAFDQRANPMWKWSVTDDSGQLLHHGHTGRRPVAAEKAFIQARDRTCRAPGCTRRAMRCDIDHRLEYSQQGPSHRGNNCCLCRRHHMLKHEQGFDVHQVGLAGFMWQAPDGGLYFSPPDGNLIAIEEARHGDGADEDEASGWDLDNCPDLPPVKYILPRQTLAEPAAG